MKIMHTDKSIKRKKNNNSGDDLCGQSQAPFTCHCCSTGGVVNGALAPGVQQHAGPLESTGKRHGHTAPAQVSAAL